VVKTTTKQKIGLIACSIIIGLIILEISLRFLGFIFLSSTRLENLMTVYNITPKKNEYRILVLGESITALGGEYSWPNQLEKILNNKSENIKFSVINEAIPGTNTAFIISRLKNNLDEYNPDMVITMMGINENGLNILYKENVKMRVLLFLNDFRVYKFTKLLWLEINKRFKEKIEISVTKNNLSLEEKSYNISKEKSIRLIIINIPDVYILEETSFSFVNDYLRDIIKNDSSVIYLNLFQAFQNKSDTSFWVSNEDQHLNEEGHKIVAQKLAEIIIQKE
jgi:lysophospholipase L1-like esterase